LADARDYFFSSGFDSLGEAGVVVLLELEPMPLVELDVLPAAPGVVEVSAPGAGVGVGAVVVEGAVGAGAGAGVTTFSSFLPQAVRPIATRAATRSERFMVFPLGEQHTVKRKNERRRSQAT
jgi:hypothetical protein